MPVNTIRKIRYRIRTQLCHVLCAGHVRLDRAARGPGTVDTLLSPPRGGEVGEVPSIVIRLPLGPGSRYRDIDP